jgi:nickel transport protein
MAHKIGAECKVQGERVVLEAYYDDDTPAGQAKVRVVDAAGKLVAEGVTDDKGVWLFSKPPAGQYKATVDAGGGHVTTIPLKIGDGAAEERISQGPTREEFTRVPWLRAAIGLAAIAGFAAALWLSRRFRAAPAANDPPHA